MPSCLSNLGPGYLINKTTIIPGRRARNWLAVNYGKEGAINPFSAKDVLIDFTLSNSSWFLLLSTIN